MNIAVLVYSLDGIGGIAKHTLYLCREFVAMGHRVVVYAIEFNREACYPTITRNLDVRAVRAPTPPAAHHAAGNNYPGSPILSYLHSLWGVYQEQQTLARAISGTYDVINAHGNTINWAAAACKRYHNIPVVWLSNDFWPEGSQRYEVVSGFTGRIKHTIKEGIFAPVCRYDEAAVRDIDRVAVLSERVKSQMMNHYGIAPRIVRPGVDNAFFAHGDGQKIRNEYHIPHDTFLLLTVSVPMPRRRIEDTIRAVRLLIDEGYNVQYMVVGRTKRNTDYVNFLQQEVATHKLDNRVIFTGEVAEEELANYYHACNAFVWSSDENQSWGMAGMEAMSAGKPLIVSKANGLSEVLEDGKTAMIIEPRSPHTIAEAVKTLMHEPAQTRSMSQRGQTFVQTQYDWRNHAEAMETLLHEALADNQGTR
jgi:glycosyltransferase involved in cell wall biosynthesis